MVRTQHRRGWLCLLRLRLVLSAALSPASLTKKSDSYGSMADHGSWLPTVHEKRAGDGASLDACKLQATNGHYPIRSPKAKGSRLVKISLDSRRPSSKRRPAAMITAVALMMSVLATVAFMAPFWATAAPVLVDGTTEQFTILVLSYGPRLPLLRGAIRHYGACPSAAEVVVVWNAGLPPDPQSLSTPRVPVRVRVEQTNSLNNRFRPDSGIRTRAVFSIDDDIRIPCRDIENAFAAWRREPEVMIGFFPRLIEGYPTPVFRGERHSVQQHQYNAILTGAAFLDATTAFPLYWADSVAPARSVVDDVFNGEDLLMNFVLANKTASIERLEVSEGKRDLPPVKFFRPSRRVDLSKLSAVGISHDMTRFQVAAERYLAAFADVFEGNPLLSQSLNDALGARRAPLFCGTFLGCLYI